MLLWLSLVVIFGESEDLEYNRVWLVDYNKFNESGVYNYLYRGNTPTMNDSFAYDELVSYFSLRANQTDIPFPSTFYFIDVSLDNTFDGEDFMIEREYWAKKGASEEFGIMLSYNLFFLFFVVC